MTDFIEYLVQLDEPITPNHEAGRGCYGVVYKSKLNGANCVVKKLHDILIGSGGYQSVSENQWRTVVEGFRREIKLLSKQRHPNIVQFLGVCTFSEDPRDICLVMEQLEMELREFVEKNKGNISMSTKLGILRDTACGISHLHVSGIVHRDLNAGNVLLTTNLQAKISDLGVSRIIDPHSQRCGTLSMAPGATDYMPPEALKKNPVYGKKLDCFSFGHLALYVVVEVYPQPREVSVEDLDMQTGTDGKLLVSIQVQKRREWIQMLGADYPMNQLICSCLDDNPEKRPDMKTIVQQLDGIMMKTRSPSVLQVTKANGQSLLQLNTEDETRHPKADFTSELKEQEQQPSSEVNEEREKEKQLEANDGGSKQISTTIGSEEDEQDFSKPGALAPGAVCVGKYNFPGQHSHDLPFRKDDVLEIILQSRDSSWYRARRSDGLEGMVPYNYLCSKATGSHKNKKSSGELGLQGKIQVYFMPWYHGKISREETEKLMNSQRNGLFLVRESTSFKGDYNLCVCFDRKVEHYRVRRDHRGRVTIDDVEYFETLVEMVKHYEQDADGLCCRLKFPVEKANNKYIAVNQEAFKRQGWSIARAKFDVKTLLTKEEFGEVWLADYNGIKVEVKIMKPIETLQDTHKFLAEAAVLTGLRHPNIVGLIGVSLDVSPICIIRECTSKGPLLDFLRTRGKGALSKKNLLDFSRNVCTGMAYLESKNIIHRDLAARNVFISEDNVAKISNFWLASEGVAGRHLGKLPVKWTAPEALKDIKTFSTKSDVWSFGILLWEIYAYGRVPYPKVSVSNIKKSVENGYRMNPPDGCPHCICSIMRACWESDPKNRPFFNEIIKNLDSIPLS